MEKFDSSNLSDESLLERFRNFNDIELLNAVKVGERFEKLAKLIVAEKYSGESESKYYNVCASVSNERVYRKFIETFGSQIAALKLVSKRVPNKKLLNLVGQHCRSAKYVIIETSKQLSSPVTKVIRSMCNLTCLTLNNLKCSELFWTDERFPQLESLCLNRVKNVNVQVLKEFLYINPQLKHLRVLDCPRFPLNVLQPLRNHLKQLKSLEYMAEELKFTGSKCSEIRAENLESLKVSIDRSSVANVLNAFNRGSKMIRNLEIIMPAHIDVDGDDNGTSDTIRAIEQSVRSFDKLTSLKLVNFEVGINHIEIFAQSLPNLTSLHLNHVQLRQISTDDILHLFEKCKQLTDLKMENEFHQMTGNQQFNAEFYHNLVDIARDRGSNIRLELIQPEKHILITEGKIIENGELRFWIGFEASLSQSKLHLFDLDDQVLEKIYDYLDDQAQRALYETCTHTKEAMKQRIKSQWFTISSAKSAKDLLNRFGEHITKLEIDMKTDCPLEMAETWKLIKGNCSENLVEMSFNNVRVDATGSVPVEFSNLTKLKVKSLISSHTHIFPLMKCLKLSQLEFYPETSHPECQNTETPLPEDELKSTSACGITLNNLSIIKLSYLNDNIEKVLNNLDEKVCDQMQEFIAEKIEKNRMESVVNIAMKFRNLTTLNIVDNHLNRSNFEYLFQNCTKLKKLTLFASLCSDHDVFRRILRAINENCKQLQLLQLIKMDRQSDRNSMNDINRFLPNVALKRFIHVEASDTYEVDNYETQHILK